MLLEVLPYFSAYIIPGLQLALISCGLSGIWYLTSFIISIIIIPILELLCPLDKYNLSKEETKKYQNRISFRIPLWCYVPFQILLIWWSCRLVSLKSLTAVEYLSFALSIGSCSGAVALNIAHELMHSESSIEKILSKILLTTVFYGHFFISHIWVHHKRVATEEDTATAKFGESYYKFFLRSFAGGLKEAWKVEKKRLKKQKYFQYGIHNQVILLHTISTGISVVLYLVYGTLSTLFFLLQCFGAISLVECTNYIEHYGLQRKKESKTYERVNVFHSWNADNMLTNYLSFKLQRHSDHHAFATKKYQTLNRHDISPQMPTGLISFCMVKLT